MSQATYRGIVQGGMILLPKETPLADGTEVLVTPVAAERGSAAAVLAAMGASRKVPTEWVDELEQLIAEGQRAGPT